MFYSKKAMSPLIATIFLIAFAVALGVMIMNWTPADSAVNEISAQSCGNIKIQVEKIPCYKNNKLELSLRNVGLDKISGIKIVANTGDRELSQRISSSGIFKTEVLEKSIDFLYTPGDSIEIIIVPLVLHDDQFVECNKDSVYINSLPTCG